MRITSIVLFLLIAFPGAAQRPETENIVIVTLDGLRWQELFAGADPKIAFNKDYVSTPDIIDRFWAHSESERRQKLMPFLWKVVANKGQLYGNRALRNRVNCTNNHLISYPGYSELLVGFNDKKVSSNRKILNPNSTVLEAIAADYRFHDEVAAFATWDAFNYILREETSGIYVNAGSDVATGDISLQERLLNKVHRGGRRTDSLTFAYAMEYLKRVRPRVTLISMGATDHQAHRGNYDKYLEAAHEIDARIAELWGWLQQQPDYQGKTTLFIATDHGRGTGKNNWRKHRLLARGSRHAWFAVLGPDTPSFGEMAVRSTIYQNQAAKTIAAFLGLIYENDKPVGDIVQTMLAVPLPEPARPTLTRQ